MNLRYTLGAILSFPLLPLMYYQGKRIRASVPKLSEAEGIEGVCLPDQDNPRILKIVSLGESTIAGVGVKTHEEGFTGTFAKEFSRQMNVNVFWKVYARSGYTASRVLQKLVPKISEQHLDMIVIGLGGNDAFTLNRPSKWAEQVRYLIDALRNKYPTAVIVFSNMPPIKLFPAFTPLIKFTVGNLVEILGEELQNVIRDYEHVFYFEELITLERWIDELHLEVKPEDFFSDGVHPSKLTYQTWATYMAKGVSTNEAIKRALEL